MEHIIQTLKQKMTISIFLLSLVLLLGSGLLLTGCGKKPNQVDPPPDVANDTFPRIYPDPSTDPKP